MCWVWIGSSILSNGSAYEKGTAMKIKTNSGYVVANKRSHYAKWLQGWIDGGGWSGATTIECAWGNAVADGKPDGCSWYAYGLLSAREQNRGKQLAQREIKELLD